VAASPTRLSDLAWACQILAAAQFFLTGVDKVSGAPPMVQLFDTVGLGQWLRYATGCLEIGSAALLLMPSAAALGAAGLAVVMIGALTAHATVLPAPPTRALILLLMVSFVFWVRRRWPLISPAL
jgi:uncharacterized membrane protein YphA (DoxX/SURF4 family)